MRGFVEIIILYIYCLSTAIHRQQVSGHQVSIGNVLSVFVPFPLCCKHPHLIVNSHMGLYIEL